VKDQSPIVPGNSQQDSLRPGEPFPATQRILPVVSVKRQYPVARHIDPVQAVEIYADSIGVRPGHVERFYPALSAKKMARDARIEAVFEQVPGAGQQSKVRFPDNQVQIAAHPADRTVAIVEFKRWRRVDLESDGAAVATPPVGDFFCFCLTHACLTIFMFRPGKVLDYGLGVSGPKDQEVPTTIAMC
jgi:D-serine deaminase-like pyridoxal phosphate-dependent protein